MHGKVPDVQSITLDNGLTVVSVPDHTAPLVAVNLWYGVGSRDEVQGRTGFAHLFEHLMFQGSRNVATGEHSAHVEGVGGSYNGTTSFDRTNYYETVPRHAAELALWLEADRMATLPEALTLSNLDNQRDVVKNERRQRYDNVPYGTSWERLLPMVFPEGHHYHHMPIGSMADLDAASLEDTHNFFKDHYGPENAVLTVAGDLTSSEAFKLVQRYMGGVERGNTIQRGTYTSRGALEKDSRTRVVEDVPLEKRYLAWRVPASGSREHLALELALSILSDGPTSRLNNRLVRHDEVAHSLGGFLMDMSGGDDLASIVVSGQPGQDMQQAEDATFEELQRLAQDGPTPGEMQRVGAQYHRDSLHTLSQVESIADAVSRSTMLYADPTLPWRKAGTVRTVTPAEVQDAAQHLVGHRAVLQYDKTPTKENQS